MAKTFTVEMLKKALDEIKQVYNLNESDIVLMTQLLIHIRMLDYSPVLMTRLIKPLGALMELITDEFEKSKE